MFGLKITNIGNFHPLEVESESDVCRRQILTSKFGPRGERVKLISTTIFLLIRLLAVKSQLYGTKCFCLDIKNLQMFGLKITNIGNFHPLEVVGRGRETLLDMREKLKK